VNESDEPGFPYWHNIMMDYYFAIYFAVFVALLHFTWVKHQVVFLLNSVIQVEKMCQYLGKIICYIVVEDA
jgi:hypothetical protein